MTCISCPAALEVSKSETDGADVVRAAVFWGAVLLVIVSPAILGAWILAHG